MAEPALVVVVVAAVYFKKADQYPGPANDEKGAPAKSFSIIIRKATTSFASGCYSAFWNKKKKSTGETSKYFAVKLFIKETAAKMNYVAASIFFAGAAQESELSLSVIHDRFSSSRDLLLGCHLARLKIWPH